MIYDLIIANLFLMNTRVYETIFFTKFLIEKTQAHLVVLIILDFQINKSVPLLIICILSHML